MRKSTLILASVISIAVLLLPAPAYAGGSGFSVGFGYGTGHGSHVSVHYSSGGHYGGRHYGGYGHYGHRSYRYPRHSYRHHSYSYNRPRHHYSRRHYRPRPHVTTHFRYGYGSDPYRYPRYGRRYRPHSGSYYRYKPHGNYTHRPYRPRYYHHTSGYYRYSPINYRSYGYGSCATYGVSLRYGYHPYSYRKYGKHRTHYRGGVYSSYPAPLVIDPRTPDRSPTYVQAQGGVPDYRAWQREAPPIKRESEQQFAKSASMSEAWDLLSTGHSREALRMFTRLCEQEPDRASCKAGYALAALAEGDQRRAFWAMRRAVMAGGGGVGFLPESDGIGPTIDQLARDLERDIEELSPSSQRLFLLAGVELLRQNEQEARALAMRSRDGGAEHESLRRMLEHLDRSVEQESEAPRLASSAATR